MNFYYLQLIVFILKNSIIYIFNNLIYFKFQNLKINHIIKLNYYYYYEYIAQLKNKNFKFLVKR